jgi:hypothetical protein
MDRPSGNRQGHNGTQRKHKQHGAQLRIVHAKQILGGWNTGRPGGKNQPAKKEVNGHRKPAISNRYLNCHDL